MNRDQRGSAFSGVGGAVCTGVVAIADVAARRRPFSPAASVCVRAWTMLPMCALSSGGVWWW